LKNKVIDYYVDISKIKNLIEENKVIKEKLSFLEEKIILQEKEINELYENQESILELKDSLECLEKYKDMCSNDIPIMASAITELYNIINVLVSGRLLVSKKIDEEFISNSEDIAYEDIFEHEDILENDKKKKKVYH
tara:strand:- start:1423 stop:1833 length:411 start_codon:yes stop_codon:yes gene_type:complete